jgi:hypothetical protein
MLRAIVIAGFVFVLFGAAMFGPDLFKKVSVGAEELPKEECDLLAGGCEWSDARGRWRVEFSASAGTNQPREYRLKVISPQVAPERFLAVLRGESMYMGEYPVPLVQAENSSGVYTARFTSPVCSTGGDMIWRIDLQQGQNIIENIPVKMMFQADHK